MKVLITGASGFVAKHLIGELEKKLFDLVLTAHDAKSISIGGRNYEVKPCDVRDADAVGSLIESTAPDAVVHLAAVSHVVHAESSRKLLSEINNVGTHNLCAAVSQLKKKVTFLFASSAMVYGQSDLETALSEASPLHPNSPYGMSKLAGEYIVRTFTSDLFKPYIVRPFNHIGPGQTTDFVCPALAKRIADVPNNGQIEVGNLKSKRDFSDVRDIVRAYALILEKQPQEDLFVLGRGQAVSIDSILKSYVDMSKKHIIPVVNETLLRKADPAVITADPALAKRVLGWQCMIPLEETLKDIYAQFS